MRIPRHRQTGTYSYILKRTAYLGMKGVNDQGYTDKVVGRELGEIFPEAPYVGVHLLHRIIFRQLTWQQTLLL